MWYDCGLHRGIELKNAPAFIVLICRPISYNMLCTLYETRFYFIIEELVFVKVL